MINIVVHIKGGLGNQMFEYAMARALQLKYPKSRIYVDISEITVDSKRTFGLNAFELIDNVSLIEDERFSKCYKNRTVWLRRAWDYCPQLIFYLIFLKENMLWWDELSYVKIPPIQKNVYVNGYWQSERFFKNCVSEVKSDFQFKYPIRDFNKSLFYKIVESESVCVHIRLGDYYEKGYEDYQVCTPTYYRNCIIELAAEKREANFFVFSDEPGKAKDILKGIDANITYIKKGNADYEDLQLMSLCKHFIISNSTFSWWAQYLSKNPQKIVYAPKKWMNSGKNKDIYLENWRKR